MESIAISYLQVVLLLLVCSFSWIVKLQNTTSRKGIPRLKAYSLIDVFTGIWMLFEKREIDSKRNTKESLMQKLYKRYLSKTCGYTKESYLLKILGIPIGLGVADYETILEIHKSEAFRDRAPEVVLNFYAGGKPGGILMNNCKTHWSEIKQYTMKIMGQLGLGKKDKMNSLLAQQLPELLERIETTRKVTGNKIQVNGLFSVAAINVIIEVVVGKKFSDDDPDFLGLYKCVLDLTNVHLFKLFCLLFAGRFYQFFGGLRFRLLGLTKNVGMLTQFQSLSMKLINEREALQIEDPESLVDCFLQKIDKHKDDEKLKDIFCKHQLVTLVQDLIVAGMDTTSKYLESLLMFMCLYPEVQGRVHQEIDAVMGTSAVPLYYECKSRMQYTLATIYEVHRMTNLVPVTSRCATKDVTIGRYHLKKGTAVGMPMFIIRYDDTYWQDPYTFNPERFLDANGRIIQNKVDRMLLFGTGPRVCPGENIAPAMAFTFATGFLQKYSLKKQDDSEILALKENCGIIVGPEPFHISISER